MIKLEDIERIEGRRATLSVELLPDETRPFEPRVGVVTRSPRRDRDGKAILALALRDDKAPETQISYITLRPTNLMVDEYFRDCQVKDIDSNSQEVRILVGHCDIGVYRLSDDESFIADDLLRKFGL